MLLGVRVVTDLNTPQLFQNCPSDTLGRKRASLKITACIEGSEHNLLGRVRNPSE